jgi:hypothetical protein
MSRFDKWTMVRLTKQTHARLVAFRDQLQEETNRMLSAGEPVLDRVVSLSDAMMVLLFRRDEHGARAKASRQRSKRIKEELT